MRARGIARRARAWQVSPPVDPAPAREDDGKPTTRWVLPSALAAAARQCAASLARFLRAGYAPVRTMLDLRRWELWSSPRRVVAWVLGWELAVLGGAVADTVAGPPATPRQWLLLVLLLAAATAHHYLTVVREERRFAINLVTSKAGEHVELSSLWLVPAAVLLTVPQVMLLLVVIRVQRWTIARRPAMQWIFSSAAIAAAVLALHQVTTALLGSGWPAGGAGGLADDTARVPIGLVVGLLVYYGVESVAIPGVKVLDSDVRPGTALRAAWAVRRGRGRQSRGARSVGAVSAVTRMRHDLRVGTLTGRGPAGHLAAVWLTGVVVLRWQWQHAAARLRRQASWWLEVLRPTLADELMLGTAQENAQIAVGLAMAAAFTAMAAWSPFLVVLLLPVAIAATALIDKQTALVEQHAALRETAHTDAKTGLLNWSGWQHHAERVLGQRASDVPVSALYFDLDRFKPLNDTYGHFTGDCVLKAIADALNRHIRAVDVAARWGGDEYAVLLPGTDKDGAARLAERFRAAVNDLRIPITLPAGGKVAIVSVTVTIGVATVPEDGPDLPSVLAAADTLMLAGKHPDRDSDVGRNVVYVAGRGPMPRVQVDTATTGDRRADMAR